jgi:hypothetical protein
MPQRENVAAGVSPAVEGGILPPGAAAEALFAACFQAFPLGKIPNSTAGPTLPRRPPLQPRLPARFLNTFLAVGMQLKTTDGHGLAQIIRRKGDHLDYFWVHPKVSSNFILKRLLRPVSHQCLSVFIRG